jgi:hypothetical protein
MQVLSVFITAIFFLSVSTILSLLDLSQDEDANCTHGRVVVFC